MHAGTACRDNSQHGKGFVVMARKKPAKKAKKKSAGKSAARKTAKKTMKKAARKAVKKTKKKAAKKSAPKRAAKPARKASAKATAGKPKKAAPKKAAAAATKKPNLDRPRKTVADIHGIPSSLDLPRGASAAKSGRAEMRDKLSKSTSGGAAITAGDVDADWQSAEAVGDETPSGDNPTPDQDVVDDIGRALGVEYADDEELQGGAEIADRDAHRWELDPSSKDDFDDEE
jgi:hypothetical protein